MGMKNSNIAVTGLVEKYIGTAYDMVRLVAENMDGINRLIEMDFEHLIQLADQVNEWYLAAGKSASEAKDSEDAAWATWQLVVAHDIPGKILIMEEAVRAAAASAGAALTSEGKADKSREYASEWAVAAEGADISAEAGGGKGIHSALHHAVKAAADALLAIDARTYATEWAVKPENTPVTDQAVSAAGFDIAHDHYSALHFAAKSFDSEYAAKNSENAAEAALADLKTKYIGTFAIPPVTTPGIPAGDPAIPLAIGALYFDTAHTPPMLMVWAGPIEKWVVTYDLTNPDTYVKIEDHGGEFDFAKKLWTPNPHDITKEMIDLGSVDDTSDDEKPISELVRQALLNKEPADKRIQEHLMYLGDDLYNPHNITLKTLDLIDVPTGISYALWGLTGQQHSELDAEYTRQDSKGAIDSFAPLVDIGDGRGTLQIDAQYLPITATTGGLNFVGTIDSINGPDGLPLLANANVGDFYIASIDILVPSDHITRIPTIVIKDLNGLIITAGDWIVRGDLEWEYVKQDSVFNIVDNLNSARGNAALSANQGRILNEELKAIHPVSGTANSEEVLAYGNFGFPGGNHKWISSEKDLGKPRENGSILVSDMAGVRSWAKAVSGCVVSPLQPETPEEGLVWCDALTGFSYVNFGDESSPVWISI